MKTEKIKITVTMTDGAIKEVEVSGTLMAKVCASFASELGLKVECPELNGK